MQPSTLRVVIAVVALVTAVRGSAGQQRAPNEGRPQPGPRLKIERGIEYASVDGRSLTLDVYRQDPVDTPAPLVVWIHGTRGGDATRATSPAVALVTPGYVVASIDYRSGPDVPLATSVADAKDAVRWLRSNAARFNIDAAHVGAFGHDTGAAIAAILGATDDESGAASGAPSARVQGVVAAAGPMRSSGPVRALDHVTADDAPMLLVHGTSDAVVSPLESQALASALKVAGVDTTFELPMGATHDIGQILSPIVMQQVTAFFGETLRGVRRARGLGDFMATPATEVVDPVALDLGGTLYRTYPTPARGEGAFASYRVYLPPAYEASGRRRYPVIYFLHGASVDSKRPITAGYVSRIDAAIRSGVMPPVIVVIPQGYNQGRWTDSRDGAHPMESIVVKNLIPHIDATYRTVATRAGRAIEGHSMGGYGTLFIGFKNPELFTAVTANSPALVEPAPGAPLHPVYGNDADYYLASKPSTLATKNVAQLKQQAIRVICGTEDALFAGAQVMHEHLTALGVTHEFLPVPKAPHNHDQLLAYESFDTMAFYGKVFGRAK